MKMLFELLISPLSISDNYFVNSIILSALGFIAFKVAFKIVGDIGARGEFGSLLHWTIRFIAFLVLWLLCCVVIILIRFIIENIMLMLFLLTILTIITFSVKYIKKYVFNN